MDALIAAAASYAVCVLIYKVSDLLSPPYHPEIYNTQKPERKVLWNTTMVAIYPGFCVPWWALYGALQFYEEQGLTMIGPANWALHISLGMSLGYMAFDTTMMLLYPKVLRKALKPALYNQMMYHHVLSILIWPYAFYADRAVLAVAYFLFTESSNIFLNARWLMAEKSIGGPLLAVVNLLLFLTYTTVRIAPIPPSQRIMFRTEWQRFSPLQVALYLFCLVPLGLNLFWYTLLIRGGLAMLRGKSKGPEDKVASTE